MNTKECQYAQRDQDAQGFHYVRHAMAMTDEGLHRKSDIAAELAHRDIQVERLTAEQAVMRQWIAEALPVLDTICAESLEESNLLAALRESGRRLVDGGPDDLLAGVE